MHGANKTKGNDMTLGTVLPDLKKMAANDAHCDAMAARADKVARRTLPNCERRVVGGEVRYYDTTDQYAIVNRQGQIIWFAVREDGDYRI